MKNVLIDCDPGIDDSVALLFALASPSISIKAITTVSGNLTADRCSINARRILSLSGHAHALDIPVACGKLSPLVRPYPRDPFFHGADGLGELGVPDSSIAEDPRWAADVIVETASKYADEEGGLTLLCLGPLTNLALALMKDPQLPSKIKEVIIIGGSFGFGNAGTVRATGDNPVSEWNIYVDPEAANIVFAAGFNLTALGLDVVTRPDIDLSEAHRARLQSAIDMDKNPSAKFLLGIADFERQRGFASYCCLIDGAAVAVALDPSIVVTEELSVIVETQSSLSLGQTIVDRREHTDGRKWTHLPRIKAASDIDAQKYLDLLVSTLCAGRIP